MVPFSSSSHSLLNSKFIQVLFILTNSITARGCYTSIFGFGDSLGDTGNLLHIYHPDEPPYFALPPYGRTYFHRPTGRFCDGRLVIDFIAEYFGLPMVPPYFGGQNVSGGKEITENFGSGVNFAVAGATALNSAFLEKRGIHNPLTNVSLGVQLKLFKEMLPSLCLSPSDCNELLGRSLFLVGEIGGNDYNYPFLKGQSIGEIKSLELIELGAVTIVVPGNLPTGCSAAFLTHFQSTNQEEYDPLNGCLLWRNEFSAYHNRMLQNELHRIRELHPHAFIIYADYYDAAIHLYNNPRKFGFIGGSLRACCGAGGPYNYNSSIKCSHPPSTCCDDPSLYVSWDGVHFTEAVYEWISCGLLEGPFANPPIRTKCDSKDGF